MNYSIAARLAISPVLLMLACNGAGGKTSPSPAPPAEVRRISPEELRTFVPPHLQGPDGPYTNVDGSDSGDSPAPNAP
jgi:hypothetical protein